MTTKDEPRGLYHEPEPDPGRGPDVPLLPSNSPRARELGRATTIVPTGDVEADAKATAENARLNRAAAGAHPHDIDAAVEAEAKAIDADNKAAAKAERDAAKAAEKAEAKGT